MKAAASVSTDIHVVMGVSASGKSTVGRLLAQARGATYLDGDDFLTWQQNLGYTHWPTARSATAAIPEPASAAMAILALAWPLALRRRGGTDK